KQAELVQERKASALAEIRGARRPQRPQQRELVRDLKDYRHRSATFGSIQGAQQTDSADFLKQAQELIPAEVIMISGCEDEQTSADVANIGGALPDPKGRAGGAATSALLELLYRHRGSEFSFQEALTALREKLREQGHSQIPQLTSSRPLDLNEMPFTFHASNRGERRAVLVGINYRGQRGELRGCHNDAYHMRDYLVNAHGFPEKDIVVLTDDGSGTQPTKRRMIEALLRLVEVSKEGDSVFFHYSGHGGFLEADQNSFKQKNDMYDQTLIPLDFQHAGQIRDFDLFNQFVRPMRGGVKVTCLMDCCHSGSVLDLPYSFKPTEEGGRGEYRQEEDAEQMAGVAFLGVLAGMVLDAGLFGPVVDSIQSVVGDLGDYEGMFTDWLDDFRSEEDGEELGVNREIEEDIEREIEQEVENEIAQEIEEEIGQEVDLEIESDVQREIEREMELAAQREMEEEIERQRQMEEEIERQRQIEEEMARQRQIEEEMAATGWDDDDGGGHDEYEEDDYGDYGDDDSW
ncbi:hypothetical protein ACHAWF_005197, partial [Thalassiosira exigua]